MRTYYFLPKDNPKDNQSRDNQSYQSIFNNVEIKNVELVTFEEFQLFFSHIKQSIDEGAILLIPSILDSFNAYSYDGVELALRCYFCYVSNKNSKFRIVVLGSETEAAFWEHCSYSNVLKCPHVDYIQNNIYSIKAYLSGLESFDWKINWDECIDALKKINISQPASYKTHHSITNEWSIYRWSKYLGIENIAIQKDIEEFLYFNYLKAIYPESKIDDPKSFLITEKGKVLLIDDEAGKGWDTFFKSFFGYSHSVSFDSIGENFKTLSQKEIVDQTTTKLEAFDPDLVLLDLRLHDEDFETKKPSELTGAKIFDVIKKKINKGIQIVIFSASNKVWNYLPFASEGIILKESPDMSVKLNYTKECIQNLRKTVENCLKKKYLKGFYSKIERVEKLILNSNCFEKRTEEIVGCLEIAFDLLTRGVENIEYNAYAYLQLFLVVEEYTKVGSVIDVTESDLYLCKGAERYRILKDKKQTDGGKIKYESAISFEGGHYCLCKGIYESRFIDTNFRVSSLLIFKFGENTSGTRNWTAIYTVRNTKAAHPKEEVVENKDIDQILDFMLFFFDENNANWRPTTDAFPERNIEEDAALLQAKFGNVKITK